MKFVTLQYAAVLVMGWALLRSTAPGSQARLRRSLGLGAAGLVPVLSHAWTVWELSRMEGPVLFADVNLVVTAWLSLVMTPAAFAVGWLAGWYLGRRRRSGGSRSGAGLEI